MFRKHFASNESWRRLSWTSVSGEPRRNRRESVIFHEIFRIVAIVVELVNALRRTQIHSL
jgi:hypothetical protein